MLTAVPVETQAQWFVPARLCSCVGWHYSNQCTLVHSRLGMCDEYSSLVVAIGTTCCLLPVRDGRVVPASDSWSWIVSVSCSNTVVPYSCPMLPVWLEEGEGEPFIFYSEMVLTVPRKLRLPTYGWVMQHLEVLTCLPSSSLPRNHLCLHGVVHVSYNTKCTFLTWLVVLIWIITRLAVQILGCRAFPLTPVHYCKSNS